MIKFLFRCTKLSYNLIDKLQKYEVKNMNAEIKIFEKKIYNAKIHKHITLPCPLKNQQ